MAAGLGASALAEVHHEGLDEVWDYVFSGVSSR